MCGDRETRMREKTNLEKVVLKATSLKGIFHAKWFCVYADVVEKPIYLVTKLLIIVLRHICLSLSLELYISLCSFRFTNTY